MNFKLGFGFSFTVNTWVHAILDVKWCNSAIDSRVYFVAILVIAFERNKTITQTPPISTEKK